MDADPWVGEEEGSIAMEDIYNSFAMGIVHRVAERATGLDGDAARLVGQRPPDHVLAGFLTPVRHDKGEGDEDAGGGDDLPQDSPYEQTSIGMEWLVPIDGMRTRHLDVSVDLCVYVRRLPAFGEQVAHTRWSAPRKEGEEPVAAVVPVWTREDIPRLAARIDLANLRDRRAAVAPLGPQIAAAWQGRMDDLDDLYPAPGPLAIEKPALATASAYAAWRAGRSPTAAMREALGWGAAIDARVVPVPTEPGCLRLSLRVINTTVPPRARTGAEYIDANLYAVRLVVRVPEAAHRATVFAELPASYRYDRSIAAVGINADIGATTEDGHVLLRTETMPRKRVDRLEPREIEDAHPTFRALAADPVPLLRRILGDMRRYDAEEWQRKIDALAGAQRQEATGDRAVFRVDEIDAFERGIALLEDDAYPHVRRAFALMNEAMGNLAGVAYDRWRLFQVVFIVIQLPRLAARAHPELGRADDDAVEILWFAAGGGKTEAFMGLLIWQMFFDRLRGKTIGVTAMVRFPLRLLTFQQLQRMSRVLAQAELLRRREGLNGPRFSLGYFVGDNTRPNKIEDDQHKRFVDHGPDPHLRSLMRCPFCGSEVVLRYDAELRLVEHHCAREDTCPGGRERLPLYIVDTDIYRYLPTVIVSTVDKLALLGQNQKFGNILGRFDLLCTRHGASFLDSTNAGINRSGKQCCAAAEEYAKNPAAPPSSCGGQHKVIYGPFTDPAPALLIQDELHLLSEEMGTFDAHYETAAVEMMRSLGYQPWKVVAATATIERFGDHAFQLYLKRARQFPCPGPTAYGSFYYHLNRDKIGRIFVGVLGVGRKHTPSVTRLLSLVYQELQKARDLAAASMADACGRYDLPPMDVRAFAELVFRYELVLTYVLTRKGSDQVSEAIQSRVEKEVRELMPGHGDLLVQIFNAGIDVTEMIDTMEEIEMATPDEAPGERVRGVVATNIISHGVDINRFNIIVFAGFTRLVAEYIQASARVGRTFPGISFFVATPQSERDRSIFGRFGKFHEYIDRLVDPSAINRWPAQALERTVPGVLVGYLTTVAARASARRLETVRKVQRAKGTAGAEALDEAEVVAWMARAYGADKAPYDGYGREVETVVRNRYAQIVNTPEAVITTDQLNMFLTPMRSLRDIDDPASVEVGLPHEKAVLRAMRGTIRRP